MHQRYFPNTKTPQTPFKSSISKLVANFSGFHCFLPPSPLHCEAHHLSPKAALASHLTAAAILKSPRWYRAPSALALSLSKARLQLDNSPALQKFQ